MKVVIGAIGKFFSEADVLLLFLGIASAIYGVILISSSARNDPGSTDVTVQIISIIIGLVLFIIFSYVDIDIIADKSIFLFAFSILFVLTLIPWGYGAGYYGRRAWLRFFGIGIQPAEIVKVTFIVIMARMITTFKERRTLDSILSLLQIGAVFAIIFGTVFYISEDLGTAVVFFAILVGMLFAGGLKLRWFIIFGAAIAAIFPFLLDNVFLPHQRARILAPFFPELVDPEWLERVSWQPDRSVEAIASGGIFGQGLGNGRFTQSPGSIPAHRTDFIFSIAGEELGFIGCLLIIALLLAIIIRCIYVGVKSNNTLGMLVCAGVAVKFAAQTIENIGMALGLMPVIGITLPFFSAGGSSIVTCFAAIGIVSGIRMRPRPARFRSL
ncbi:MAG: FtsW/RodA/SpoVE family cell cycle protein [Oscillospiraceae bacterium]|nr:FtsW/RodA/SpoVE family cell cycle protein [Oscillospiraceae bacterium]